MKLVRCYKCMKEFDGAYDICPHCGYDMTEQPRELYHLFPSSVLQGRYVVGVVIGSGGFGVTYKAWDTKLDTVVAVKEYFPLGIVNRVPGNPELIVYSGNARQEYRQGLARFLDEARNMAKFSNHENVVNAYSFFEENQTAYIVMEYLDGLSFKDFLRQSPEGTKLSYTMEIILAVANALKALHSENIIHRDISPDNVFLLNDGKIKLIDFGASRLSVDTEKSIEVQLKIGYAPPEQYQTRGKLGPWTDIYALGAMMYRAVTGTVPPESVDRQVEDTLIPPKEYMPELPDYINDTIMRALALDIRYRFQSVQDFTDGLTNKKRVVALEQEIKKRKRRRRLSVSAACIFLMCIAIFTGASIISTRNGTALKETVEVWVKAEPGEAVGLLKSYYEDASDSFFGQDYKAIDVNIKVVEQENYETELMAAFSNGTGPEVFESTDVSNEILNYAAAAGDFINSMKEEPGEYYFLSELSAYGVDDKSIPVGFVLPVAYSVQREHPDILDTEAGAALEMIDESADLQTQVDHMLTGQVDYLLGTTGDYTALQQMIYGTFDSQKEEIAGELSVVPVLDAQPEFTTAFCINKNCKGDSKQAARLFLQYLLLYNEQHMLHGGQVVSEIGETRAFSVNSKADLEYRNEVKPVFSVLNNQMEQWKGGK